MQQTTLLFTLLVLLFHTIHVTTCLPANLTISTVAGGGIMGDGGPATNARLLYQDAIALSPLGHLFVADFNQNIIRRVDATTGVISTVVWSTIFATGVAAVGDDVYYCERGTNSVKKLSGATGLISTVAGNGTKGFSGDGGPAVNAMLSKPVRIFVSQNREIFIVEHENHRIRKVFVNGTITTVVGNGQQGIAPDGTLATNAAMYFPTLVWANSTSGEVYFSEFSSQKIRKVNSNGTLETVAGNGSAGFGGDGGPAVNAMLNKPTGLWGSLQGELFIADSLNHRIRKVFSNGTITTIAGNGIGGGYNVEYPWGDGGLATNAVLAEPVDVVATESDVYISDNLGSRIRKVNSSGYISTFVGIGNNAFLGDNGPATIAVMGGPSSVAFTSNGEMIIAEETSHRIRKVMLNGYPVTLAGNGTYGFSGEGTLAKDSTFNGPRGVCVCNGSDILIADMYNHRIRKIASNGIITTIAGNGTQGYNGDSILASKSLLNLPQSVQCYNGEIYIADSGNHRIRKIATNGLIYTIVGNGTQGFNVNPLPLKTQLSNPSHVFVSPSGTVFISDTGNHMIRMLQNGTVTTIAGNGTLGFSGDGSLAVNSQLNSPRGVAMTENGEIVISDSGNNRIRQISLNGTIQTIAGKNAGLSGDGGFASDSQLSNPSGVTVWNSQLFIADRNNGRVRRISATCESGYLLQNKTECIPICFNLTGSDACGGPTRGNCSQPDQCTCVNGYGSTQCEMVTCFGILSNNNVSVCSGHGTCVDVNRCMCSGNYIGLSCDVKNVTSLVSSIGNMTSFGEKKDDQTVTIVLATVLPIVGIVVVAAVVTIIVLVVVIVKKKQDVGSVNIELKE